MSVQSSVPSVSVVLPVYNAEQFIELAVRSVLEQEFRDLELIAIDDGSNDGSLAILERFAESDSRMRVITRENKGLVATLNQGVNVARGRYVARMDADDISVRERLGMQVAFMDEYSSIDVVGCHYELIDGEGRPKRTVKVPLSRESIFLQLSYTVPFAHPSVLIRRSALVEEPYVDTPVEDYRLWVDLFNGNNFANIDSVLLRYRHDYGGSFSDTKRLKMIAAEDNVRDLFFTRFGTRYDQYLQNGPKITDRQHLARSMLENRHRLRRSIIRRVLLASPKLLGLFAFYFLRRHARTLYWRFKRR
ncbi:glycosyltransferase [Halothiobacillus sp.]|uniref:glycosyltransferase n=1 Tax=Halothiobacillus sp. TaxID=1891311 RepID=UPI002AD4AFB6|nr:glycosyltransferase [Halothiobacillus sp.]